VKRQPPTLLPVSPLARPSLDRVRRFSVTIRLHREGAPPELPQQVHRYKRSSSNIPNATGVPDVTRPGPSGRSAGYPRPSRRHRSRSTACSRSLSERSESGSSSSGSGMLPLYSGRITPRPRPDRPPKDARDRSMESRSRVSQGSGGIIRLAGRPRLRGGSCGCSDGGLVVMAEREGFEPPVDVSPQRFSRAPHSTALPPLHRHYTGPSAVVSSQWSGPQGKVFHCAQTI
jgi:hypothetical protein